MAGKDHVRARADPSEVWRRHVECWYAPQCPTPAVFGGPRRDATYCARNAIARPDPPVGEMREPCMRPLPIEAIHPYTPARVRVGAGHVHDYESTWPIKHGNVTQASLQEPRGIVHVTEGNGGVPGDETGSRICRIAEMKACRPLTPCDACLPAAYTLRRMPAYRLRPATHACTLRWPCQVWWAPTPSSIAQARRSHGAALTARAVGTAGSSRTTPRTLRTSTCRIMAVSDLWPFLAGLRLGRSAPSANTHTRGP